MILFKKSNFILTAFLLVGVFNSTAQDELWLIPLDVAATSTPMILAVEGTVEDYVVAGDQDCAQLMADTDPYCINTDWDNTCQENYNGCVFDFNCSNQDADWYLPLMVYSGPIVYACEAPVGYFLADQECAQYVVSRFPSCLNVWGLDCQDEYNRCLYDQNCTLIGDYFLGDWYLPNDIEQGPMINYCYPLPPEDYYLADQTCAQFVVNTDPYCLDSNWDAACMNQYNCCLGIEGCGDSAACNYDPELCHNPDLCQYPQLYIPFLSSLGPAIFACERPSDYTLADQFCAQYVMDLDDYCGFSWDGICQSAYDCCQSEGCTDPLACNYDSTACVSVNNTFACIYGGCTYVGANNYDSSAACDDGSCVFPIEGNECVGDLNGDLIVTTADLSIFLAAFGTSCQ